MPKQNHAAPQPVPAQEDSPALVPMRKTQQMLVVEQAYDGLDIRLVLKRLYEETGSQKAVADRLGLQQSTITIWAIRLRITFTQRPIALIEL
jgi:transcriptional regulator with GAF, ATPase, and Fis domain